MPVWLFSWMPDWNIVMGLALAYGCTDEYHQLFVEGRSCDAMDLIADSIGGLIGGSVYVLIVKILNKYDPLVK